MVTTPRANKPSSSSLRHLKTAPARGRGRRNNKSNETPSPRRAVSTTFFVTLPHTLSIFLLIATDPLRHLLLLFCMKQSQQAPNTDNDKNLGHILQNLTTVTSGMKEEWKEQWSFNKYVNNRLDEQDGRHDKHDEDISKLQSTAKKQEAQNAELRRKVNTLEKSQVKLQKLVDKQQQVLGPVGSRLFRKSCYYSLVFLPAYI